MWAVHQYVFTVCSWDGWEGFGSNWSIAQVPPWVEAVLLFAYGPGQGSFLHWLPCPRLPKVFLHRPLCLFLEDSVTGVHPKLSGEKVKLNCRCLNFIQRHVGFFFSFFLYFYFMRMRLLSFSKFESFCSLHCGLDYVWERKCQNICQLSCAIFVCPSTLLPP